MCIYLSPFYRFKLLASDKSFWTGNVAISDEWSALDWTFLIEKCLNERWISFRHFSGEHSSVLRGANPDGHWQTKDIESIATKCPNLQLLIMGITMNANMQSWPMLAAQWTSLVDLTIHCRPKFGGIFEGVELHLTLPNLWRIVLTEDVEYHKQEREPSFLPDLKGCNKLQVAVFMYGFFRFGEDILPGDDLPLPPGLDTLNLGRSQFHEEFMNRIKYEDIKKVLPGLKRLMGTHPNGERRE